MNEELLIDLFPLSMPLLPGCKLPLRIFEPRYLDMISRCMKQNKTFTIVQIKKGTDIQADSEFFNVGTQASIVDFDMTPDQCLAISVIGINRVEIEGAKQLENGQWVAKGKLLEERGSAPEDDKFLLRDLLEKLMQHDMIKGMSELIDYNSNEQIMNYLIMLLPFSPHMKQSLIETDHHELRWQGLVEAIARLEQSSKS